jgi:hypothetical protein
MRSRIVRLLIPLAVGIGLGLVYGWVIQPAEYVNVTPAALRSDYRADYVLMVAEAHQSARDPDLAAQRLAMLGSQAPDQIVLVAVEYARLQSFTAGEMAALQDLLAAMQTFRPTTQ